LTAVYIPDSNTATAEGNSSDPMADSLQENRVHWAPLSPKVTGELLKLPMKRTGSLRGDSAAGIDSLLDAIVEAMPIDKQVGQMIMAQIGSESTPSDVREKGLGALLHTAGNEIGVTNEPKTWRKVADRFYREARLSVANVKVGDRRMTIKIGAPWAIDGNHGHAIISTATIFPHMIGMSAANDPKLTETVGRITGQEMSRTGIDWVFAPMLAVTQDEANRWGRVYETFGQDPNRVANHSQAFIKGVQGSPLVPDAFLNGSGGRILATAKHWIGEGETDRGEDQGNALISEQRLHDVHARGFYGALNAGALSVMVGFNEWMSHHLTSHKYLVTDVLKTQMNFMGLVVTDWYGWESIESCELTHCNAAVNAGVDMFMAPDRGIWRNFHTNTLQAIKRGEIPKQRIHDAVKRILRVKSLLGLIFLPEDAPIKLPVRPPPRVRALGENMGGPAHRNVAREAVRKSLVLLKNERGGAGGSALPLRNDSRVLVAGHGCDSIEHQSGGWTVKWQGPRGIGNEGFGSKAHTIFGGVKGIVSKRGGKAIFAGTSADVTKAFNEQGPFDAAIMCLAEETYAEYFGDILYPAPVRLVRDGMQRAGTDRAILDKLHTIRSKMPANEAFSLTIIALTGRPLDTTREINLSDAFVVAWLPGPQGGAIADVLFGEHDFHGTLPIAWPLSACQRLTEVRNGQTGFHVGYGMRYGQKGRIGQLPHLETSLCRPDGFSLLGEGVCTDSQDKSALPSSSHVKSMEECSGKCLAEPTCQGFDITLTNPQNCRLFVNVNQTAPAFKVKREVGERCFQKDHVMQCSAIRGRASTSGDGGCCPGDCATCSSDNPDQRCNSAHAAKSGKMCHRDKQAPCNADSRLDTDDKNNYELAGIGQCDFARPAAAKNRRAIGASSLERCGEACDDTEGCLAFDFSYSPDIHTHKQCHMLFGHPTKSNGDARHRCYRKTSVGLLPDQLECANSAGVLAAASGACCSESMCGGQCGGAKCGSKPGGAKQCCENEIFASAPECKPGKTNAPCKTTGFVHGRFELLGRGKCVTGTKSGRAIVTKRRTVSAADCASLCVERQKQFVAGGLSEHNKGCSAFEWEINNPNGHCHLYHERIKEVSKVWLSRCYVMKQDTGDN